MPTMYYVRIVAGGGGGGGGGGGENNSILCALVHNEGYYATSDNARSRSKPRRSRGVGEA